MVNRQDDFFRQEAKEITFYIILGLVMAIVIPLFFGFALGGFEESFIEGRPLTFGDFLLTYIIYYIFIVVGLIGLPILKIREMIITDKGEHPANQSDPKLIGVSYIHDPEQDGLLYNLFEHPRLKGAFKFMGVKGNLMVWSLSMLRIFVIATLIFGGIGILQVLNPGLQVVGIPQMLFQFTAFGEVFFSAEPPAFAETTMLLFVFSLFMGFNAYLSSKLKIGKVGYYAIGFVVSLLIGGLWMGYHEIAYGSSEAGLLATFIFGSVGALLTLLFGTFIFWYVWHFWNNIFAKISEIATIKEDVIFFSVIIWVVLLLLWIGTEFVIRKYRKRETIEAIVPD